MARGEIHRKLRNTVCENDMHTLHGTIKMYHVLDKLQNFAEFRSHLFLQSSLLLGGFGLTELSDLLGSGLYGLLLLTKAAAARENDLFR